MRLRRPSAHRLAHELPDATDVFPTHGFGSFCSATQSDATDSTIGRERESNPALADDEETYVRELLAGLDVYPACYTQMTPANAAGPSAPDELRRRCYGGARELDHRGARQLPASDLR